MVAIVLVIQMTAQFLKEHRMNCLELVNYMLREHDVNSIVVDSRSGTVMAQPRLVTRALFRPAAIVVNFANPLRPSVVFT
jgi:hypothetical protein